MGNQPEMNPSFAYFQFEAWTDPGYVRSNNEDSYAILPEDGCCLVADGMGGGSAGELASQIVEDRITEAITGTAADSPGLRKCNVQQAILRANREIFEYAKLHNFLQMGSTLALFLADSWNPQNAWLCHVGDSRIYRWRNGELALLTHDHSIGMEFDKLGIKALEHIPTARLLTRAIGVSGAIIPEWTEIDVCPEDRFLLCSDGLTSMCPDSVIAEAFQRNTDSSAVIQQLVRKIQAAGAKDNFTMICCSTASILPAMLPQEEDAAAENRYLLKTSEERID